VTQASSKRRTISVSVREIVEFVLRTGNLGGERDFVGPSRALEGTRGHQKIQKSRPEGYLPEVRIKHQIDCAEFVLTIKGRIDGVLQSPNRLLIEEIKTVLGDWKKTAHPLHWAQAKCYAYMFAARPGESCPQAIEVQLTYFNLDSDELTEFQETIAFDELRRFFDEVTSVYLDWASRQHQWIKLRDASIGALAFPHVEYRRGQRQLAVAAYRALVNGGKLFVEAPTGIGKTVSILFPAIKALGEGHLEKVFFLTAKTTGRQIAETTAAAMCKAGLRLRTLTITAKDKICFNNGRPCEVQSCPFAIGYYDRLKPAILDALSHESLGQPQIEAVARQHNVCPFALSLDVSVWADLIICDYNYVFDPRVFLKRFFAEDTSGDHGFLIDEAHNLVDRAREMFSAELNRAGITTVREQVESELAGCAKALGKVERVFREMARAAAAEEDATAASVTHELPKAVLLGIEDFLERAQEWLQLNEPADFRPALLQLYFELLGFARTAESFDERYVTIFEAVEKTERLRLFCLDPSAGIQNALRRGKSAVFCSATLRPIEYYREILGGEIGDVTVQLQSPFPAENLAVMLHHKIQTDFRGRSSNYGRIAHAIGTLVTARPGNYLVFFPSYKFMEAVHSEFLVAQPFVPVIRQTSFMSEEERRKFIAAFQSELTRPLVGFAVMGGIFGEGIDLVGERLVGAIVAGVGLPQVCLERELIRTYFNQKNGSGFEYAYAYPGITRVIQAAGRVIRSERDRGVVLLIDSRFAQSRYQELLPAWWTVKRMENDEELATRATAFWAGSQT
jgi:DNA excision repair protein ERCC-2